MDVRGTIKQVHDLRQSRPRHVSQPRQFRQISHNAVTDPTGRNGCPSTPCDTIVHVPNGDRRAIGSQPVGADGRPQSGQEDIKNQSSKAAAGGG